MKNGIIILKPDFFENIKYFEYLQKLLNDNEYVIQNVYPIQNYVEVNSIYRKKDLHKRFKLKKEYEKNFERTKISLLSYKEEFQSNFGLLLEISTSLNQNKKVFYDNLFNIKNQIRKTIEEERKYSYLFVYNEDNTFSIIRANLDKFDELKQIYKNKIKLAFINGVHLDDYPLFKKNFCKKIFKKLKVIKTDNKIDIKDIPYLFENSSSLLDLHIHSSHSDGVFNTSEIVDICKKRNLKMASITDHDVFTKILPIKETIFIFGMECNALNAKKKIHILCYNMDTTSKYFIKLIDIQEQNRIKTLMLRIQQLKSKFNILIPDTEKNLLIQKKQFSRNYLAELLVKYKYASSFDVALKKYINLLSHGDNIISLRLLSKLINKSNGFTILAHPLGNYKHRETFESFIKSDKSLKYCDGVECFYSDYTNIEIENLICLADKKKILITCGSDFHGNGDNVTIGTISKEKLTQNLVAKCLVAKKRICDIIYK